MKLTKAVHITSCVVAVLLLAATTSRADWPFSFQLEGALYVSDGGLVQTPPADGDPITNWEDASFTWDVSFNTGTDRFAGDSWATYTYTFDVGTLSSGASLKELSHFVIGLSQMSFSDGLLRDFAWSSDSAATWNTYPGIDSDDDGFSDSLEIVSWVDDDGFTLYGLKFEGIDTIYNSHTDPPTTLSFQFESQRQPMWGSVELKDGRPEGGSTGEILSAENASYDVHPAILNAPFDGLNGGTFYAGELYGSNVSTSIPGTSGGAFAALVPDTEPINLVPEPCSGALALLLAVAGLATRRSERRAG